MFLHKTELWTTADRPQVLGTYWHLVIHLDDGRRLDVSPNGEHALEFRLVDADGDIRESVYPSLADLVHLVDRGFPMSDETRLRLGAAPDHERLARDVLDNLGDLSRPSTAADGDITAWHAQATAALAHAVLAVNETLKARGGVV